MIRRPPRSTLFPTRRSSDLIHHHKGGNSNHESDWPTGALQGLDVAARGKRDVNFTIARDAGRFTCEGYLNDSQGARSEEHTSELQSQSNLVCRLLLEKKKKT